MFATLRPGTYRDRDDNLVTVRRAGDGFTITHADGTVTAIGGRS
jgi:hypothetical protein